MIGSLNRFALALGVLDGEKDTHKILADLFEEQGQRGLAQWARSRKNNDRKRLDLTLAIMPCQFGLDLACDFTGHVIPQSPRLPKAVKQAVQHLSTLKLWAATQESAEQVAPICRWLTEYNLKLDVDSFWTLAIPWRDYCFCFTPLAEAARRVEKAVDANQEYPSSKRRHFAFEASVQVRYVAKAARNLSGDSAAEVLWQVNHTTSLIQKLLNAPT